MDNNPGQTLQRWKFLLALTIGILLMVFHVTAFFMVPPINHPFYRSCVNPAKKAFVYRYALKKEGTSQKIDEKWWSVHLLLLSMYQCITSIAIITIIVAIRLRGRDMLNLQNGSDFRTQFQIYTQHVEKVGLAQVIVAAAYFVIVIKFVPGQTNLFHVGLMSYHHKPYKTKQHIYAIKIYI